MKKRITIVLCLVLIGMAIWGIAQPVSAAGSAHMSIRSSSGTLYRGDSFTLTVSLSNDQPVSNGGVVLSYDSSVFEFLGGSCHVSNAVLAEVSAANGGGVFVMQTDEVVSGTIFTFNMRVKDSAPVGSYSISGTPSLSVSCTFSGTSVSVACRHSYENCTKVDGSNHQSTCALCGQKKTEAHAWNSGTVTKAATCKETGTKRLTCTGCGATKDETIPVTNDHKYGNWSKVSETKHSRTCGVCGKKETASHTWNSGKVTKKATCQETGSRKLTCTACDAAKTETIDKTAHSYGDASFVDDSGHRAACKSCGHEVTQAHQYGDAWKHDENWHFRRCGGCGHEKDQAAHEPGPKATETTDQICTVCSRVLQPKGTHVHSFAAEWSVDETGHWYACGDCNEKDSAALHVFDNDCDADCNTCGMNRQPLHAAAGEWSADESGHWYACRDCDEKVSFVPHIPGPEATITSAQSCTACGYELAPVLPHDHAFDEQGKVHIHRCACGEIYEAGMADCDVCDPFPWWIVCVAEAVVFCAVSIGFILWLKKRGILPSA